MNPSLGCGSERSETFDDGRRRLVRYIVLAVGPRGSVEPARILCYLVGLVVAARIDLGSFGFIHVPHKGHDESREAGILLGERDGTSLRSLHLDRHRCELSCSQVPIKLDEKLNAPASTPQ